MRSVKWVFMDSGLKFHVKDVVLNVKVVMQQIHVQFVLILKCYCLYVKML